MEVLKESLDPFLMDTRIRWHPPEGYSVVDSSPKSLGTVFCNQTRLAFAFLKKTSRTSSSPRGSGGSVPPATVLGSLEGAEVEIEIAEASLPPLSPVQTTALTSILVQVGQWSRLEELEIARLVSVSRKYSTEDEEESGLLEPKAKRRRLNGEVVSSTTVPLLEHEIQRDLLQLSLESGIPCPFTFLLGTATDGREIVQALPFKRPPLPGLHKKGKNGVIPHMTRKHPRKKHHHHLGGVASLGEPQHVSRAAALAKSTISAVSNSFMNLMNMFSPDPLLVEGGKTIEDEVELQRSKKTQLFWDETKGEIKYPATYYQDSSVSSNSKTFPLSTDSNCHSSAAKPPAKNSSHSLDTRNGRCLRTEGKMATASSTSPLTQRYVLDTSSSSDDEEDVTISDSESDSSLELDWESLPKTREYLPLIQMQLFSGAWPLVHEFCYAVRVPLGEIGKLPLRNQSTAAAKSAQPRSASSAGSANCFPVQRNCLQETDDEAAAHFWTTALAVVCFRECFPQFEEEWELIVRKGEEWLQNNLDQCTLCWPAVQTTAKELLFQKA